MTVTTNAPAGPYETRAAQARRELRRRVAADFRKTYEEYPGAKRTKVYAGLAEKYGISEATVARYVKLDKAEAI